MGRGTGIFAPRKRAVIRNEHSGNRAGIKPLKSANDCRAGIFFVLALNFVAPHGVGYRNRTVEVVGMSCAKARDLAAGLRPGGRVLRVRVNDPADLRKRLVQSYVRGKIRGRTEIAF